MKEKGVQYGLPLTGLLLKFSFENQVPLDYLFGGTSSSAEGQIPELEEEEVKKRPPSSHYRIFRELLSAQDPITAAELVKKMGLPYAYFAPVLKDLNRHGVITYQSIKTKQPISSYRLSEHAPDQLPPTVKTNVRLTQEVYNVIKRIPDKFWTIDEVSEAVTTDGTSRQNTPSLKAEISRILSEFERTNYTAKNSFSHENMSKIGLSEDQRELLSKLMTLLYKFKNQDPQTLADGLRSAREFALENPQKAREIMLQAYRASSHAGRNAAVTQSSILEAIENQPSNFQTMDGIITYLKDTYQLEVSPKTVQRYIRDLSSHKLISFDGSGWKTTSNSPDDVS
jgi:predicted ArsR family transcriptional regulator